MKKLKRWSFAPQSKRHLEYCPLTLKKDDILYVRVYHNVHGYYLQFHAQGVGLFSKIIQEDDLPEIEKVFPNCNIWEG